MSSFSHFDETGRARMVDVSSKKITRRTASAQAEIFMKAETLGKILNNEIRKGDAFAVAKIAGIMAAKNTSSLIPLCHPLALSHVEITFSPDSVRNCIAIRSEANVEGKTGAEMEALTAASVSALAIYDMCKAVDRDMIISNVCLLGKTGGKSGTYKREQSV